MLGVTVYLSANKVESGFDWKICNFSAGKSFGDNLRSLGGMRVSSIAVVELTFRPGSCRGNYSTIFLALIGYRSLILGG